MEHKITVWEAGEDDFIRKNYLHLTDAEVGVALNRTKYAVSTRMRKLKLLRPRVWSISFEVGAEISKLLISNTKDESTIQLIFDTFDLSKVKDHFWIPDGTGYIATNIKGRTLRFHELITKPKRDFLIDHIDRDKLNNRQSNFRYVTRSQNTFNSKLRKDNKLGIRGVHIRTRKNGKTVYRAHLRVMGKWVLYKTLPTLEEAVKARKEAEVMHFKGYIPTH